MPNKQLPRYFNASTALPAASGSCGMCGIDAPGGVQLIYWQPDATSNQSSVNTANNEVYTYVENGFTFTSPSVYVVYSSLRATVTCDSSILETTGPSFEAKTIAYSSRFLAYGTLEIPGPNCDEYVVAGGFHTIDFQDLYTNPITTSTLSKPGCPPYVNPRLSLPADLTTVDPAWARCEPLFYGAFDPPTFLTKARRGLVPSAASEPTAAAAGVAVVSNLPAVASATPALVTPAPTATTNGSPSNPSPMAAPPAQNAGPSGPIQPSQAAPAIANTPASAVEAVTTSPQQSVHAVADPDKLSPDQLSKLHEALQSTKSAEPVTGNLGAPAVDIGGNNAPATPVLAPSSLARPTQQNPQESVVYPNIVLETQNVPQSASGQGPIAANPPVTQTQSEPIPLLVDPGKGAAKEGNAQVSTLVGVTGPTSALTQSMAKAQNDPSPILVDPGKGALLEANSENSPAPAGAESASPATGTQQAPIPIFVDPENGAFVEGSSNNGVATSTAVIHASAGLTTSQPTAASHPLEVDSSLVDTGFPDEGPKAGVSISSKAGNADIIGNSATITRGRGENKTPIPLMIGGNTVQRASDGALLVAGQTVSPGSQATVSGTVVFFGNSNVFIDGTTHAFLPTPSLLSATLMVEGNTAQRHPGGGLLVASQTVTPGSQATVSGVVVSVGATNIVVGVATHVLSATAPESPSPLLVGGQTAQRAPNGALIFGSRTIAPGSQVSVSGVVVSVGAHNLVVDGTTHVLSTRASESPTPLLIGAQIAQKAPDGALVVGSRTIAPGSQATISGHLVSVGASELIVDASTHFMSLNTAGSDSVQTPFLLSVAGYAVQKAPTGGLVIASQTISPGSQATISGVVVSVGTNDVIVDGTTHSFLAQFAGTATPQSVQSIVYTESNIAITLSSGATFPNGGSVITYTESSNFVLTKPTEVVAGTTTVLYNNAYGSASATSKPPIGGLIASALGGDAASSIALSKASSDSAPERSGNANGASPALGTEVRKKSSILLRYGIFAFLGYITSIGLLV